MNHTLLKLLGGKSENGGTVVAAEWEANPALGWAGWIALAAAALFVIFISYRRRDVTLGGGRLAVLTALKAIALLIILAILLRPGLALSVEGLVRQTLVFAIDQSASFGLRDPRTAPEDRARAAIALGLIPPTSRIDQGAPSMDGQPPRRVDLVAGILTNREMALIERF
jgi:hypothetical protein